MSIKRIFLVISAFLMVDASFATQVEGEDYVQLEYLEAKGSTLSANTYDVFCVDTLIPAKTNVAIETMMACTPAGSTELNYMGAVYGQSDGWIAIGSYAADNLLHAYFAIDNRTNAGVSIAYDSLFHYYYVGNGRQVIDDKTAATTVAREMGTKPPAMENRIDLTIKIFSPCTSWMAKPIAQNKVQYFNVYTNGIPARQLIPVRCPKEDDRLCFYDKVTDGYFYAEGPGELKAGPDVSTALQRMVSVTSEWYFEGAVTGPAAGEFADGTELTYVAEPKPGYEFAGWSGDTRSAVVDGNRLSFVVSSDMPSRVDVKAKFAKVKRPHVFSMSVKATSFAEGGDLVSQNRRTWLADWLKTYGFTKVYLESYRHNVYAPTETLTAARNEFRAAGFEVCGLITPTCLDMDPAATPASGGYATCFSNPQARLRLSNEVARCAALFDTILLDDFLYANCSASCPYCKNATAAFRLELVNTVSREIVAAARAANPNCRCIMKYPTWRGQWAERGLVPSEQTAIFGECWVGNETRDAGADPFWAHEAYDYLNNACGGRCGGVWFDPLDSKPAKYVEQAYYSILGGAPESLFHCYDYMLGDNGGTTPFGEDYSKAKDCTALLETKMEELHRLADFCDAAERKLAEMQSNGVSQHVYVKDGETYRAWLNTKATPVELDFRVLAANEFIFPTNGFIRKVVPGGKYLPGDYLVLQYIYSTPSAPGSSCTSSPENYIDTGYTPTSADFGFYFDFAYNGMIGPDAPRIMGTSVKDNSGYWGGIFLNAYSRFNNSAAGGEFYAFDSAASGLAADPWLVPGRRIVLELKNRLFMAFDGKNLDLTKCNDVSGVNGSVWVGNINTPDYATKKGAAPIRIYRFKIYEGDVVAHDFVPVQAANGSCGLYDVVGDKGFCVGKDYLAGPWCPDEATIRRVQYIESSGTQYFDLGVLAHKGVTLETEMACCGNSSNKHAMGAIYGGNKGWIVFGNYGQGYLGSYFAQNTRVGAEIPCDTEFHRYYCGNGIQSVDATSASSTVVNEMPKTLNLMAFASEVDYNALGKEMANVKVKFIKVYSNRKLVRNLVPVVAGGKACMYDKVSKEFFLNEGTGEFNAGPSVGLVLILR